MKKLRGSSIQFVIGGAICRNDELLATIEEKLDDIPRVA